MNESVICKWPPEDGRDWHVCCARCGSDVETRHCEACNGSGATDPGELYEIDPLWYDEDDIEPCGCCQGDSTWHVCLSSEDWCKTNPAKDREAVQRGALEWWTLDPAPYPSTRVRVKDGETLVRLYSEVGPFAVTQNQRPDIDAHFAVTHKASGLRLPGGFYTQDRAESFCREILPLVDWSLSVDELRQRRMCCAIEAVVNEYSHVPVKHDADRCAAKEVRT